MKLFSIVFATTLLSLNAFADTCGEKILDIQEKIEKAQKRGQTSKIKGLETALSQTQANCTDESLQAAKLEKIRDQEEDVTEARQELEEAKTENKSAAKIKKKQAKLDREIQELEALKLSLAK